ncbi:MAG: CsbD family protein [Deltaproteobacteria bacterium]|nr:CsbD family protein [Deltaproteobacteria bacterium]
MNKDQLKGKLEQLTGEMKKRWGQLTDDDITEARGDMQKLMGRIRERSRDNQEEIERWFSSHNMNT